MSKTSYVYVVYASGESTVLHTTSGVRAVGTTLQHNTRRCEYKLIELGCSMVRDMRIDQDQRMSTRGRACRRGGPHAIRAPWGPSFRRHTPDQCPWTPVACKHRKTKILGHCTVLVDNSSKTLDNRALVVLALSLTAACLQLVIANVPPARPSSLQSKTNVSPDPLLKMGGEDSFTY